MLVGIHCVEHDVVAVEYFLEVRRAEERNVVAVGGDHDGVGAFYLVVVGVDVILVVVWIERQRLALQRSAVDLCKQVVALLSVKCQQVNLGVSFGCFLQYVEGL